MVKSLSLFLAVVVFMLTITPCCALEGSEANVHEITQKEKHECNEKSDDCCKDCSPFSVCGTCVGFTSISPQTMVAFVIAVKPISHNTVYISVALPVIPVAIWQPPKIS